MAVEPGVRGVELPTERERAASVPLEEDRTATYKIISEKESCNGDLNWHNKTIKIVIKMNQYFLTSHSKSLRILFKGLDIWSENRVKILIKK